MAKIIKIESCKDCCLDHIRKMKLNCPMTTVPGYGLPAIIVAGCPLEDLENYKIKTTANNTGVTIK